MKKYIYSLYYKASNKFCIKKWNKLSITIFVLIRQ